MLSHVWMRRIASANRGATETTWTFAESSTGRFSTESVTNSFSIGLASIFAVLASVAFYFASRSLRELDQRVQHAVSQD